MKAAALKPYKCVTTLSLLPLLLLSLLCSCATIHPPLPADVPMNPEAGRSDWLILMVRMDSGEPLPFVVDTGAPVTCLDQTLEPKLGKRLAGANLSNFGASYQGRVYRPPGLYLGNTPLRDSGAFVVTMDFKFWSKLAHRPIMGFLGMDVLKNYCIQFDFENEKIRFLNPGHHLSANNFRKAFPISFYDENPNWGLFHPFIQQPGLLGGPLTNVLIDSGYRVDGAVDSEHFQREIARQKQQDGTVVHGDNGRIWVAKCVWNGETCTNLLIGLGTGAFRDGEDGNIIGLGFLARHLVTLDFPGRTMYLYQTETGPLMDENKVLGESLINTLKARGKLPGWSTNDVGTTYLDRRGLQIMEFDGRKNGDPSDYHYQFSRLSETNPWPWKLQKAWRTDQDGTTIQEFPVQ